MAREKEHLIFFNASPNNKVMFRAKTIFEMPGQQGPAVLKGPGNKKIGPSGLKADL